MSLREQLEKYAKKLKDWEKVKTSIKGVSIVKLPSKSGVTKLALEINPVDEENKPLKRKPLFITNKEQWLAFQEIFANDKGLALIENIEEIAGPAKIETQQEENEEILEV